MDIRWPLPMIALRVGAALHHPLALPLPGPGPKGNSLEFQASSPSRDPFLVERVLRSIDHHDGRSKPLTRLKREAAKKRRPRKRFKRAKSSMAEEEDGEAAEDNSDESSYPAVGQKRASNEQQQASLGSGHRVLQRDFESDLEQQKLQQPTRRYNQPRNKKPVYVSINQQTVNGLLSLLLLFVVSICGTVGTIFIISALTVIESLQTRGNCYLVSLALAQLIVTLLVIPTSALQIMAGDGLDGRLLCHFQWLTLEFSLIVSQLSFLLIAADNYLGYKSSEKVTTTNKELVSATIQSTGQTSSAPAGPNSSEPTSGQDPTGTQQTTLMSKQSLLDGKLPPSGSSPRGDLFYSTISASLLETFSRLAPNSSGGKPKFGLLREQFSDAQKQEDKFEKPGCFSYRNCCSRLRVLFWILLVWLVALAYTFHQQELRYGANFCPVMPASPIPSVNKQPTPLLQQTRAAVNSPSLVIHTGNGGGPLLAHKELPPITDNSKDTRAVRSGRSSHLALDDQLTGSASGVSPRHPIKEPHVSEQLALTIALAGPRRRDPKQEWYGENEKGAENSNGLHNRALDLASTKDSSAEATKVESPSSNSRIGAAVGQVHLGCTGSDSGGVRLNADGDVYGNREPEKRTRATRDRTRRSTGRTKRDGPFPATSSCVTIETEVNGTDDKRMMNKTNKKRWAPHYLASPKLSDGPHHNGAAKLNGPISIANGSDASPVLRNPRQQADGFKHNEEAGTLTRRLHDVAIWANFTEFHPPMTVVKGPHWRPLMVDEEQQQHFSSASGPSLVVFKSEDNEEHNNNSNSNNNEKRIVQMVAELRRGTNTKTSHDSYHRNNANWRLIGSSGRPIPFGQSCLGRLGNRGCIVGNNVIVDDNDNSVSVEKKDKVNQLDRRGGQMEPEIVSSGAGVAVVVVVGALYPEKPSIEQPLVLWRRRRGSSGLINGSNDKQNTLPAARPINRGEQEDKEEQLLHLKYAKIGSKLGSSYHRWPVVVADVMGGQMEPLAAGGQLKQPATGAHQHQVDGARDRLSLGASLPQLPFHHLSHMRRKTLLEQQNVAPEEGDGRTQPHRPTSSSLNLMNNNNHKTNNNEGVRVQIIRSGPKFATRLNLMHNLEAPSQSSSALSQPLSLSPAQTSPHMREAGPASTSGSRTDSDGEINKGEGLSHNGRRSSSPDDGLNKILPPATNNGGKKSIVKRGATSDKQLELAAGGLKSNQLLISNLTSVNITIKSDDAASSGRQQPKFYWLMLFGTILGPSLASLILFLKAWLKMKEFKTRPYKPMPMVALNSTMSSLLMPMSPVPVVAQPQQRAQPTDTRKGQVASELDLTTTTKNLHGASNSNNGLPSVHEDPGRLKQPSTIKQLNDVVTSRLAFDGLQRAKCSKDIQGGSIDVIGGQGRICKHNRRSVSQPSGGSLATRAGSAPATNHVISLDTMVDMQQQHLVEAESQSNLQMNSYSPPTSVASVPPPTATFHSSLAPAPLPPSPIKLPPLPPALPAGRHHQQVNQVMSAPIGYNQFIQQHLQPLATCPLDPNAKYAYGLHLSPQMNGTGANITEFAQHLLQPGLFNETLSPHPLTGGCSVMQHDISFSAPSSATFRRDFGDELFGSINGDPPSPPDGTSSVHSRQESMSVYPPPQSGNHRQRQQQQHQHHHHHHYLHNMQSQLSRRISPIQIQQPQEQSQQHEYEFRRRQNHAQSFHYGTGSNMRHYVPPEGRSQLTSGSGSQPMASSEQQSYRQQLAAGCVLSADRIDAVCFDELQPPPLLPQQEARSSGATMTVANNHDSQKQHQQHLLERHRSLPRSSRLYQSEAGGRAHSDNGAAAVGASISVADCAVSARDASTTNSRQMRRHRKQQQRASIEGQIDEIGATTMTMDLPGQVMDGGLQSAKFQASFMSKALANIIKSTDESPMAGDEANVDSAAAGAFNLWDENEAHINKPPSADIERLGGSIGQRHHSARVYKANDNGGSSTAANANANFVTDGRKWKTPTDNISSSSSGSVRGSHANHGGELTNYQKSNIDSSSAMGSSSNNKAILCTYSYMTDNQLLQSNIIVFILNLTLWLPFILLSIAAQYRDHLTQELKDSVWWLATLNCCSCSYVYAITNKDFREAFNKLFYYCCCKSHVTFQRKTPIFRRQLDLDSKGNLRIHIIPGLNVYSNKLSKGGDANPVHSHESQALNGGLSSSQGFGPSGGGQIQSTSGHHHDHAGGGVAGSLATGGAHRHHMSVGGGFGGPLFASSKLYGGHGSGSGHHQSEGRAHGRLSGYDRPPASEL